MTGFEIEPKTTGKKDPRNRKQIRFHIFYGGYERDKEANELDSSNHEILLTTIQKKYDASCIRITVGVIYPRAIYFSRILSCPNDSARLSPPPLPHLLNAI